MSKTKLRHKRLLLRSIEPLPTNEIADSKFSDCFYGLISLVIMVTASFSVTLLPVNNVLEKPEYWYELIFSTMLNPIYLACATAFAIENTMNGCINKRKMIVIMELYSSYKIAEIVSICLLHLIWSDISGYYEPFPHRQLLSRAVSFIAYITRLWHLMPKQIRIDTTFRKRWKAYIGCFCWGVFITKQLILIEFVLVIVPRDVQWIVALIVPLSKEMNDWVVMTMISMYVLPRNLGEAKFVGKILLHVLYSFWLAISVAGRTTLASQYLLLGINVIIDLRLCAKVIQLDRKASLNANDRNDSNKLKQDTLTELILNEYVEVMLPIAYIGTFSLAFYGPNKNALGNVGIAIWQYKEVENLYAFLMPVVEMALIDSACAILTGFLLWRFCHINVFKEFCIRIKKYWIYLAFWGGASISGVGIIIQKRIYIYIYIITIFTFSSAITLSIFSTIVAFQYLVAMTGLGNLTGSMTTKKGPE